MPTSWFPREVGSVCDRCTEGRVLLQYASNSSSPRPCAPSGHWSPREAEGTVQYLQYILLSVNIPLLGSTVYPPKWEFIVTFLIISSLKSILKSHHIHILHHKKHNLRFLFCCLFVYLVFWVNTPTCTKCWWLTQPQTMQMTHWIHNTWAVGQHGGIEEVISQWMVLYGTTIPPWRLRPKTKVKDHVLALTL